MRNNQPEPKQPQRANWDPDRLPTDDQAADMDTTARADAMALDLVTYAALLREHGYDELADQADAVADDFYQYATDALDNKDGLTKAATGARDFLARSVEFNAKQEVFRQAFDRANGKKLILSGHGGEMIERMGGKQVANVVAEEKVNGNEMDGVRKSQTGSKRKEAALNH